MCTCGAAARSLTNRLSARGQYTSACSRLPLTMACRCTPRTIHPRCSQVLLRAADGRLCARVHLSVHCGVQRAVHLVRSCSTQRSECMSTAPRFCQVVRRREVECQSHQSIRQTNDVCDDGVGCACAKCTPGQERRVKKYVLRKTNLGVMTLSSSTATAQM